MPDSTRQVAFSTPRNAEIHASRLTHEAAQKARSKREEAYDAMHAALVAMLNVHGDRNPHTTDGATITARAALALAEACK
jgi:hypothetical protein